MSLKETPPSSCNSRFGHKYRIYASVCTSLMVTTSHSSVAQGLAQYAANTAGAWHTLSLLQGKIKCISTTRLRGGPLLTIQNACHMLRFNVCIWQDQWPAMAPLFLFLDHCQKHPPRSWQSQYTLSQIESLTDRGLRKAGPVTTAMGDGQRPPPALSRGPEAKAEPTNSSCPADHREMVKLFLQHLEALHDILLIEELLEAAKAL